jgi:hypothetical protein
VKSGLMAALEALPAGALLGIITFGSNVRCGRHRLPPASQQSNEPLQRAGPAARCGPLRLALRGARRAAR